MPVDKPKRSGMFEIRIAVFTEYDSPKVGHFEAQPRRVVTENPSSDRPMSNRLDHVLADTEVSDTTLACKNGIRITALHRFDVKNGIDGFLQPSVPKGERLMPRKLELENLALKEASQSLSSLVDCSRRG